MPGELIVKVININYEMRDELLKKSSTIADYSYFVHVVRHNIKEGMNRDNAVKTAIKYCISEGILKDFLLEHSSEVINMLFEEFRLEDYIEVARQEAFEDGELVGERRGEQRGEQRGEKKMAERMSRKLLELGIDPDIIRQAAEIGSDSVPFQH